MTNFLTSWRAFDVMTIFSALWRSLTWWQTFLSSWRIFDLMMILLTSWCVFYVMTFFSTSWHFCWRHDVFFHFMANFLSSTFLVSWCVLTSWWTFWRHDAFWCHNELSFDIMMYFRCYDILFNFMTYILMSWRIFHIFWPHDVFLDLLFNILMYFSTLYCTFDVIFRRNDVLLNII